MVAVDHLVTAQMPSWRRPKKNSITSSGKSFQEVCLLARAICDSMVV